MRRFLASAILLSVLPGTCSVYADKVNPDKMKDTAYSETSSNASVKEIKSDEYITVQKSLKEVNDRFKEVFPGGNITENSVAFTDVEGIKKGGIKYRTGFSDGKEYISVTGELYRDGIERDTMFFLKAIGKYKTFSEEKLEEEIKNLWSKVKPLSGNPGTEMETEDYFIGISVSEFGGIPLESIQFMPKKGKFFDGHEIFSNFISAYGDAKVTGNSRYELKGILTINSGIRFEEKKSEMTGSRSAATESKGSKSEDSSLYKKKISGVYSLNLENPSDYEIYADKFLSIFNIDSSVKEEIMDICSEKIKTSNFKSQTINTPNGKITVSVSEKEAVSTSQNESNNETSNGTDSGMKNNTSLIISVNTGE